MQNFAAAADTCWHVPVPQWLTVAGVAVLSMHDAAAAASILRFGILLILAISWTASVPLGVQDPPRTQRQLQNESTTIVSFVHQEEIHKLLLFIAVDLFEKTDRLVTTMNSAPPG